MMYQKYVKRLCDIIFAIIGLLVTFPIWIIVAIPLIIANKGSLFFTQSRPGKDGKLFNIIKFKTMNDLCDKEGKLLPNSIRTHSTGKIIRLLSLDELPQMLNVLKGDMSFIGPRPLLPRYLPYYTVEQARRHTVRPGITGWAQVNGRNSISWEEKFEFDLYYIDHISMKYDIQIILMTIYRIIARRGINASNDTTMLPFDLYCREHKYRN